MNVVELQRALRQLRCSGMATALEARLLEAQAERLVPLDFLSRLIQDELLRRQDRLLERRVKLAGFRDADKRLDTFDFDFNKKMPRALVFELATARWVTQHDDALFLGPPGSGKSHLAQALGLAVIQQGHRVLYREAHQLLEDLAAVDVNARLRVRVAAELEDHGGQRRPAGSGAGEFGPAELQPGARNLHGAQARGVIGPPVGRDRLERLPRRLHGRAPVVLGEAAHRQGRVQQARAGPGARRVPSPALRARRALPGRRER